MRCRRGQRKHAFSSLTHHASAHALPKALFAPPKAIRGGIPICFPQFSDFGPLGQHGFARNKARRRLACVLRTEPRRFSSAAPAEPTLSRARAQAWELASVSGDRASAAFVLRDSEDTRAAWSHSFEARYMARCGAVARADYRGSLRCSPAGVFAVCAVDQPSQACAGLRAQSVVCLGAGGSA